MRISASFGSLSPAEQEKLRANADRLRKMSPEREQMLDIYRGLHADHQGMVRDKMRAR